NRRLVRQGAGEGLTVRISFLQRRVSVSLVPRLTTEPSPLGMSPLIGGKPYHPAAGTPRAGQVAFRGLVYRPAPRRRHHENAALSLHRRGHQSRMAGVYV